MSDLIPSPPLKYRIERPQLADRIDFDLYFERARIIAFDRPIDPLAAALLVYAFVTHLSATGTTLSKEVAELLPSVSAEIAHHYRLMFGDLSEHPTTIADTSPPNESENES